MAVDDSGRGHTGGRERTDDDSEGARRKVKLYELDGSTGGWGDRGTGTYRMVGGNDREAFPRLQVLSENSGALLLDSVISPDHDYTRQKETIITWNEPNNPHSPTHQQGESEGEAEDEGSTYRALSFQTPEGCNEVWAFLAAVKKHRRDEMTESSSLLEEANANFRLVELPSVGNLQKLLEVIEEYGGSLAEQGAKEALAQDVSQPVFLHRLATVFDQCEDLEAEENLTRIFNIVKKLVLMSNQQVTEALISDDHYELLFGALEYDDGVSPESRMKHRDFFRKREKFKQPLSLFKGTDVLQKIRSIFRIQYLKDVACVYYLDDVGFTHFSGAFLALQLQVLQSLYNPAAHAQAAAVGEDSDSGHDSPTSSGDRGDRYGLGVSGGPAGGMGGERKARPAARASQHHTQIPKELPIDVVMNRLSEQFDVLRLLHSSLAVTRGLMPRERGNLSKEIMHRDLYTHLDAYIRGEANGCRQFELLESAYKRSTERYPTEHSLTLDPFTGEAASSSRSAHSQPVHIPELVMSPLALSVELMHITVSENPSFLRDHIMRQSADLPKRPSGDPPPVPPEVVRGETYASPQRRNHAYPGVSSHGTFGLLCDILAHEPDAGLQQQVAEIIKMLLDTGTMDQMIKDEFLTVFYDKAVLDELIMPLVCQADFPRGSVEDETLNFARQQVADICGFCVSSHAYRAKYFMTRRCVILKVLSLAVSLKPSLAVYPDWAFIRTQANSGGGPGSGTGSAGGGEDSGSGSPLSVTHTERPQSTSACGTPAGAAAASLHSPKSAIGSRSWGTVCVYTDEGERRSAIISRAVRRREADGQGDGEEGLHLEKKRRQTPSRENGEEDKGGGDEQSSSSSSSSSSFSSSTPMETSEGGGMPLQDPVDPSRGGPSAMPAASCLASRPFASLSVDTDLGTPNGLGRNFEGHQGPSSSSSSSSSHQDLHRQQQGEGDDEHPVGLLPPQVHRHVQLAAIRFFKRCLLANDDFYRRYVMRYRLFRPVFALVEPSVRTRGERRRGGGSLVESAVADIFRTLNLLRPNSQGIPKELVKHLMAEHGELLTVLAESPDVCGQGAYRSVIQCHLKHEELERYPPDQFPQGGPMGGASSSSSSNGPTTDEALAGILKSRAQGLKHPSAGVRGSLSDYDDLSTPDSWFEDDDDDHDTGASGLPNLGPVTVKEPMPHIPYPDGVDGPGGRLEASFLTNPLSGQLMDVGPMTSLVRRPALFHSGGFERGGSVSRPAQPQAQEQHGHAQVGPQRPSAQAHAQMQQQGMHHHAQQAAGPGGRGGMGGSSPVFSGFAQGGAGGLPTSPSLLQSRTGGAGGGVGGHAGARGVGLGPAPPRQGAIGLSRPGGNAGAPKQPPPPSRKKLSLVDYDDDDDEDNPFVKLINKGGQG
uniref:Uncharacterized protein n=1 Tax=Chromera velia CCMP2878 TaxID=1169474 RepID=A0A0G4GXY0_9ALVE|eukprot:Cvel_5382.t1-p1 / transcript=Cvel_5382.t1 / gene=Cvel_5382 / organism=Chromera_velia_CCMP2878 / gene_product=Uncharacterized protein C216.01c, putative / transcript_product=Uncharacterized protein C216.01c, putative / location=Cvel_scaffold250:62641-73513(+) / protein_length=1389 / sequence_SO=supercontig / SO=protein_coding / is_pseudo=false